MLKAIAGLLLAVFGIAVFIYWIFAVSESDGRCHLESCKGCLFSGDCPEQGRREKEQMDERNS